MSKQSGDFSADELAQEQLDRVFGALSDPVRRRILERLHGQDLLVSELAEPFEISLQAVSRHIQVLEEAGLVQKERTGRISRCSLSLGPIVNAAVWINRYSRYWQEQFEVLAASLAELEEQRLGSSARRKARPRTAKAPARTSSKPLRERGAPRLPRAKPRS